MSDLVKPITCVWSDELLDVINAKAVEVKKELYHRMAEEGLIPRREIRLGKWHEDLANLFDGEDPDDYKLQVTLEMDDGGCRFDAEVDIMPHVRDTVEHELQEDEEQLVEQTKNNDAWGVDDKEDSDDEVGEGDGGHPERGVQPRRGTVRGRGETEQVPVGSEGVRPVHEGRGALPERDEAVPRASAEALREEVQEADGVRGDLTGATEWFLTRLVTGTNEIRQGVKTIRNAITHGAHRTGLSLERMQEIKGLLEDIEAVERGLSEHGDES